MFIKLCRNIFLILLSISFYIFGALKRFIIIIIFYFFVVIFDIFLYHQQHIFFTKL